MVLGGEYKFPALSLLLPSELLPLVKSSWKPEGAGASGVAIVSLLGLRAERRGVESEPTEGNH